MKKTYIAPLSEVVIIASLGHQMAWDENGHWISVGVGGEGDGNDMNGKGNEFDDDDTGSDILDPSHPYDHGDFKYRNNRWEYQL